MTFHDAYEFVTQRKGLSLEELVRAAFAEGEKQGHKLPLRELHKWREVFGHLGSTPDECGNAILARSDAYQAEIDSLEAQVRELEAERDSRRFYPAEQGD